MPLAGPELPASPPLAGTLGTTSGVASGGTPTGLAAPAGGVTGVLPALGRYSGPF